MMMWALVSISKSGMIGISLHSSRLRDATPGVKLGDDEAADRRLRTLGE